MWVDDCVQTPDTPVRGRSVWVTGRKGEGCACDREKGGEGEGEGNRIWRGRGVSCLVSLGEEGKGGNEGGKREGKEET